MIVRVRDLVSGLLMFPLALAGFALGLITVDIFSSGIDLTTIIGLLISLTIPGAYFFHREADAGVSQSSVFWRTLGFNISFSGDRCLCASPTRGRDSGVVGLLTTGKGLSESLPAW